MPNPKLRLALLAQLLAATILIFSPGLAADGPLPEDCNEENEGITWCSDCYQLDPYGTWVSHLWICESDGQGGWKWNQGVGYAGPSKEDCDDFASECEAGPPPL